MDKFGNSMIWPDAWSKLILKLNYIKVNLVWYNQLMIKSAKIHNLI